MNSEFYKSLGKKIKDRRKSLKMTQHELCGDYITRNMLSRIETGVAHPSLDTLIFIAERLKMPIEYFVATEKKSEAQYRRIETITEIRRLYSTGQYHRCIDLAESAESDDDEISFIIAEACYMIAKDNLKASRLRTAADFLRKCMEAVSKCSYNSSLLTSSCSFWLSLIAFVRQGVMPAPDIFNEDSLAIADVEFLVYLYSMCIGEYSDYAVDSVSNVTLKNHLKAKQLMRIGEFEDAAVLLKKTVEARPAFFTLYFVLVDLELCSQKTEDYRNAYEYTKRRLELIEIFEL